MNRVWIAALVSLLSAPLISCGDNSQDPDMGVGKLDTTVDSQGCGGCRNQAGICQLGTSPIACGTGGGVCATCNAGEQCINGSCQGQQQCNATNCAAGCCDAAGMCVLFANQGAAACGAGGAVCTPCGTGNCQQGMCQADPNEMFNVVAFSADSTNSGCADGIGAGECDLVLKLTINGTTMETSQMETLTPVWNETLFTETRMTILSNTIGAELTDIDVVSNDDVALCTITVVEADLQAGAKTVSCAAGGDATGPSDITIKFVATGP